MIYRDVWPKYDWMEIFVLCKLAGFTEKTGRLFIDAGVPPAIVLERLRDALQSVQ